MEKGVIPIGEFPHPLAKLTVGRTAKDDGIVVQLESESFDSKALRWYFYDVDGFDGTETEL